MVTKHFEGGKFTDLNYSAARPALPLPQVLLWNHVSAAKLRGCDQGSPALGG